MHQQLFDNGRPDEHARERGRGIRLGEAFRLCQEWQLDVGYEALDLATEMIPVHPHIQAANELLAAFLRGVRLLREQDEPRASAPRWFPRDSVWSV